MPEILSAMGGWGASLEADAQAEKWDGVSHGVAETYSDGLDVYAVCRCGRRIDGVDRSHVDRQMARHVLEAAS